MPITSVSIPLIGYPETFRLILEGVPYQMRTYWLLPAKCWVLDISDDGDNPLIMGVPLVTGADLLAQYSPYIGPPGVLAVIDDSAPIDEVPPWGEPVRTLFYISSV